MRKPKRIIPCTGRARVKRIWSANATHHRLHFWQRQAYILSSFVVINKLPSNRLHHPQNEYGVCVSLRIIKYNIKHIERFHLLAAHAISRHPIQRHFMVRPTGSLMCCVECPIRFSGSRLQHCGSARSSMAQDNVYCEAVNCVHLAVSQTQFTVNNVEHH